MLDRAATAARNNALWCDAVCRAHGIRTSLTGELWSSASRTPPYYPDAVTLSAGASAYDVLASVDAGEGCSVKDSFATLDLSSEDFTRLVDGHWLWRGADGDGDGDTQADSDTDSDTGTRADGRRWHRVISTDEMHDWARAWAADPDDAAILTPALLAEPGVFVLATEHLEAGAIVNLTGSVAGVSNVFDRGGDHGRAWREAVGAAGSVARRLPLVGWDAGDGLRAAVAAGFEATGPLTVWMS